MKKHIFISFFSVLLLLSPVVLFGQKLSIETKLDTNRITLGDQVRLHYIVEKDADIDLTLPKPEGKLIEGVELLGEAAVDSVSLKDSRERITLDLLLTSFDTGLYYIPPQPFAFRDGPFTDTAFSKPSYLHVQGVAIDTTNTIRDIKAIAKEPLPIGKITLFSLLGLIVAGAIGYWIWWLHANNNPQYAERSLVPKKPEEAPYVTALRELDRIKAQKLWQQQQVKEYYTRITHIIRWFIGKTYAFPALEETTGEILERIREQRIDKVNLSHLEELLNLADLVKFAKGQPDPDENIKHLDNAYTFVKTVRDDIIETEKNNEDTPKADLEK